MKALKRPLSVILSIIMILGMFAIVPMTAGAANGDEPSTITVYFTDSLYYGSVNVYYWPNGGEWPGTAMTEHDTNDFGQKVYSASIPADATGIIFNGNDKQTVDITSGIEDGAWWYTLEDEDLSGHNYVKKVGEDDPTEAPTDDPTEAPTEESTEAPTEWFTEAPTEESTEAPTEESTEAPTEWFTEAPTEEPTEPPVGSDKYYIIGSMTEWEVDADYEMFRNTSADTTEYALRLDLQSGDEFKVVMFNGGDTVWYPDGSGNNYSVDNNGEAVVYFRPNGDGGEDWYSGVIYVAFQEPEQPTGTPTEEPTEAPTDEPSEEPSEGPAADDGFYIAGTMNNYSPDPAYKLIRNDEADGEEFYITIDLKVTDQFKVAYTSTGKAFDDLDWYPTGTGNNYGQNGEITEDGTYTVYFRPDGNGAYDWFYGVIYVQKNVVEEPTESTPDEASPDEATPDEPIQKFDNYFLIGTMNNWHVTNGYMLTKNEAAETEEYCITLDLSAKEEFKITYYSLNVTLIKFYPDGVGNNYIVGQNGKATVYFRPNYDGNDDWYDRCIYVDFEQPESTPDEPSPTEGGGDRLVGDVNSDGEVNNRDAMILDRYVAGWEGYADRIANPDSADLNRDSNINNRDAMILDRVVAGWEGYYDTYIIKAAA